jgi:hypothetical protein
MKAKILFTSILFSISLLPNLTPAAHALGCVSADISNQVKLTGSKEAPGVQQNAVNQTIDPNTCVGSVNVGKRTQVYVGAEGADQVGTSTQHLGGVAKPSVIPANVMDSGNVKVKVGTQTSVYSPGLDPKFLPKR